MAGHNDGDEAQLRGRAGLQWQQEKQSPPLMTFKQQWDALPPLPELHSGGRARSLQASSLVQGTAASLSADLVCWLAPSLANAPLQMEPSDSCSALDAF